jgi:hypothetical protein
MTNKNKTELIIWYFGIKHEERSNQ